MYHKAGTVPYRTVAGTVKLVELVKLEMLWRTCLVTPCIDGIAHHARDMCRSHFIGDKARTQIRSDLISEVYPNGVV